MLRPLIERRASQPHSVKPEHAFRMDRLAPPPARQSGVRTSANRVASFLRLVRVPLTSPPKITYASYPHIVEAILVQSDYKTKLHARLMCWGIKTAVDRSLLSTSLLIKPRLGGRDFSIRSRAGVLPWFHPLGNRAAQLATLEETLELSIAGRFKSAPRLEYWLLFLGEDCVVRIAHDGVRPAGVRWTFVRPRRLQIIRNEYCSCGRDGLRISHEAEQVALTVRRLPMTVRGVLDAMAHFCQSNCALANGVAHVAVERLVVELPRPAKDGSVAGAGFFLFGHLRGTAVNPDLHVEIVQYGTSDEDAALTRLQAAWELGVDPDNVTSINIQSPFPRRYNYWVPY